MNTAEIERDQTRLGLGTRIAFGVGAVPDTLKFLVWDMFILFYYTQVLGLSGSLTGLALAIAVVIDAVTDPLTGITSDRLRGLRFGRRHTLILISIIPFCVSYAAIFMPPTDFQQTGLFVWLSVFAVLSRVSITLFTIPYQAIGAELSRNPAERPVIYAFRQVASGLARIAIVSAAFTFFFYATPEQPNGQMDPERYPVFGIAVAITAFVSMVWLAVGTFRPIVGAERGELAGPVRGGISLRAIFSDFIQAFTLTPNVRRKLLIGVFMFVSLGALNVLTLHLSTYFWRLSPDEIRNVAIALAPGTLIAAFVAPALIRRIDKLVILQRGIAGYALAVLIPIVLPLTGIWPPIGSSASVVLIIVSKFVAGFCYGLFLVGIAVLGADICDEHEVNSGKPAQGTVSALNFFVVKLSSALVTLVAGVFLDIIAFPVGVAPEAVPELAVTRLATFAACLIGFASMIVVWGLRRLEVSDEKQRRINDELNRRRYGEDNTATD